MTTVLERSGQLTRQIEALRNDPAVSKETKLLSLTIEASLLRIEDRLITIEGGFR
jgi:hypothetical protein